MVAVGSGTPEARELTFLSGPERWARRGGVWLLYATPLAPLVFYLQTIYPYVVPRAVAFRVLVAAAAGVSFYFLITRRRALPGWRRDPFLFALISLVLVLCATALAGAAPIRSLFGDLERMGGVIAWVHFLAFYVALRTLLTEREFTVFLWVTVAVASVVSGIALLQTVGVSIPPLPTPEVIRRVDPDRAISTIGNAGYLAVYAGFGMAVAALLGLRSVGALGRVAAAVALLLNAVGLTLTWTRAALAGVVVGVLVGLVAYVAMAGSRRRRAWALGSLAGVLFLGGWAASTLWSGGTDGRGAARVASVSQLGQGVENRIALWRTGLQAVGDDPLTGLGMENFRLAFDWNMDPRRFSSTGAHFTRAHNDFVEYLIAGGVPGALAWIAVWGAVLFLLVAARREGALGAGETALLGGTFAAYLVYLVFWFHDQNSLPVFLALVAFVAVRRDGPLLDSASATPGRGPRAGRLALGVLLALLVAGDGFYHGRLLATGHHLWRAAAAGWGQLQTRVDEHKRALELRPAGAEEAVRELMRFTLRLPEAIRAAGGEPSSSTGVDTVLARSREFQAEQIARDARNPQLYRDAGRLYVASYRWNENPVFLDSAAARLGEAIALAPGRVNYRHMLSEALLMADRTPEAIRVLEDALRRYGDLGETHYFLAQALVFGARYREAADALTRAYELGYRDRNPTVRQRIIRELRASGQRETAARMLEARRTMHAGSG